MAQLIQVRLARNDAQPWGFRLQGGKDFGTPLVVQKVNGGSLSEQAGLLPGDAVIKINDADVFNLRHKDAQDIVVRSGNNFVITVQRGGTTWRPTVTPTGQVNSPQPHLGQHVPTVTKTSLAHKPQEVQHIGSGYNNAARPFNAVNGDGPVKSIVNKQYNTPVGIYSEESIAETLSAQAEVLAGGVLGVNFKKNEKVYNAANSEVLKFLREEETDEPAQHSPQSNNTHNQQQSQQQHHHQQQQHQQQQQQQQYNQNSSATRHVTAPVDRPKAPNSGAAPGSQNICTECERLIVGVFVRIKDKNLHVECFKCATCGTSLKNQGYYNFNNKLYCDIHAKLAAMQSPPSGTEGYVPVPIKPNTQLSANTISAALNSHGYAGLPKSNGTQYQPPSSNVNQPYARPFGASQISPPSAAPKSPSSYPPQPPSWTQPKPTSNVGQNQYATLPRSNVGQQGRSYNTIYRNSGPNNRFIRGSASAKPPQISMPSANAAAPAAMPLPSKMNQSLMQSQQQQQQMSTNIKQQSSGIDNSQPDAGPNKGGVFGATSAPKRGRGIMNKAVGPGARTPHCNSCNIQIRGPFITALGSIWCPEHFICVNVNCRRPLQDIGFVEEKGDLYCEYCFEKYLAPTCSKCNGKIKGDCLNAIGKHFHPECFTCTYCGKLFGNTPFFLEEGEAYCEADWNELFTTKCYACGFPVEAGDRWVEALSHNYHSQCFNCTMCKKNLEGQSFYNKGGRPFCKNHAR